MIAGNKDKHKSLDEFVYRRDSTTEVLRSYLPLSFENSMNNRVRTLAPSSLIRSSSFLQAMRTTIRYRTSLNFSPIGPQIAKLSAFECLKKFI